MKKLIAIILIITMAVSGLAGEAAALDTLRPPSCGIKPSAPVSVKPADKIKFVEEYGRIAHHQGKFISLESDDNIANHDNVKLRRKKYIITVIVAIATLILLNHVAAITLGTSILGYYAKVYAIGGIVKYALAGITSAAMSATAELSGLYISNNPSRKHGLTSRFIINCIFSLIIMGPVLSGVFYWLQHFFPAQTATPLIKALRTFISAFCGVGLVSIRQVVLPYYFQKWYIRKIKKQNPGTDTTHMIDDYRIGKQGKKTINSIYGRAPFVMTQHDISQSILYEHPAYQILSLFSLGYITTTFSSWVSNKKSSTLNFKSFFYINVIFPVVSLIWGNKIIGIFAISLAIVIRILANNQTKAEKFCNLLNKARPLIRYEGDYYIQVAENISKDVIAETAPDGKPVLIFKKSFVEALLEKKDDKLIIQHLASMITYTLRYVAKAQNSNEPENVLTITWLQNSVKNALKELLGNLVTNPLGFTENQKNILDNTNKAIDKIYEIFPFLLRIHNQNALENSALRPMAGLARKKTAAQEKPLCIFDPLEQLNYMAFCDKHQFVRLRATIGLLKTDKENAGLAEHIIMLIRTICQDFISLGKDIRRNYLADYQRDFILLIKEALPYLPARRRQTMLLLLGEFAEKSRYKKVRAEAGSLSVPESNRITFSKPNILAKLHPYENEQIAIVKTTLMQASASPQQKQIALSQLNDFARNSPYERVCIEATKNIADTLPHLSPRLLQIALSNLSYLAKKSPYEYVCIEASEAIGKALPSLKGDLQRHALAYAAYHHDYSMRFKAAGYFDAIVAVQQNIDLTIKAHNQTMFRISSYLAHKNHALLDDEKVNLKEYLDAINPFCLKLSMLFDGAPTILNHVIDRVFEKTGFVGLYRFLEICYQFEDVRQVIHLTNILTADHEFNAVDNPKDAKVSYWIGRSQIIPLSRYKILVFKFPRNKDEEKQEILEHEAQCINQYKKALSLPIDRAEIVVINNQKVLKYTASRSYFDYADNAYPWLSEKQRIKRFETLCENTTRNIFTLFRKGLASKSLLYLSHLIWRGEIGDFDLRHGGGAGEIDNPHLAASRPNLGISGIRDLKYLAHIEGDKLILQNIFEVLFELTYSGLVNNLTDEQIQYFIDKNFNREKLYIKPDILSRFIRQMRLDLKDPHDVFWVQYTGIVNEVKHLAEELSSSLVVSRASARITPAQAVALAQSA